MTPASATPLTTATLTPTITLPPFDDLRYRAAWRIGPTIF